MVTKTKTLLPLIKYNPFPYDITIPEKWIWTSSAARLFQKCKRKFFWKYIMRINPNFRAVGLLIGDVGHKILAHWYKGSRIKMAKIAPKYITPAFEEATANEDYYDDDEYQKLMFQLEMLTGMMMGYEEVYANDRKEWNIERSNIERSFSVDLDDFFYNGKVDLFAHRNKSPKQKVVWDHKTQGIKISGAVVDRLPMDFQFRGYIFGSKKGLGYQSTRFMVDIIYKCKLRKKSNESQKSFHQRIAEDYMARPDFYFYREEMQFSQQDILSFEHELRCIHQEFMQIINERDPYDPWSWPTNGQSCTDFNRTCELMDLCRNGLNQDAIMLYHQRETLHQELNEQE